jgi:hypothetical protein
MLFQRVMMGRELLDCPSCHRILFFVPPATEPSGAAPGTEDAAGQSAESHSGA